MTMMMVRKRYVPEFVPLLIAVTEQLYKETWDRLYNGPAEHREHVKAIADNVDVLGRQIAGELHRRLVDAGGGDVEAMIGLAVTKALTPPVGVNHG